MKKSYDKNIQLRCAICGSADDFEYNEDKTHIRCKKCNKEYVGGYGELVEANRTLIQDELEATQVEVKQDVEKELRDMLTKAFKGNKYVRIK